MALSFLTYSKKEQAPLWIRYREGKIDAKVRTPLIIDTDRLVKGKIVKHKIRQSDNAQQKDVVRNKNKSLDLLQIKMNEIYRVVQDALNEREDGDLVDKHWMKRVVHPNENSNLLTTQIDSFLNYKKLTVKESSHKLYKQLKGIVMAYEKKNRVSTLIKNVDLNFRDSFLIFLEEEGYSNNSIRQHIGCLMQVLKFASERGATISNKVDFFRKGLKKQKTLNVYLTFDEIKTLSELEGLDRDEAIARDWLVISCYTAQRVSDMFKFNSKDISEDGEWLTVQQTKNETSSKILVPIMTQVREILNRYNGEFPPLFSNEYQKYLRTIKRVCKKAGLNEMTKTLVYKTKEEDGVSQVIKKPKYELIGTHIGRRSFATNFYGKVPAALIMSVTGHLTESSFLLYINRERLIDRKDFMKQLMDATK